MYYNKKLSAILYAFLIALVTVTVTSAFGIWSIQILAKPKTNSYLEPDIGENWAAWEVFPKDNSHKYTYPAAWNLKTGQLYELADIFPCEVYSVDIAEAWIVGLFRCNYDQPAPYTTSIEAYNLVSGEHIIVATGNYLGKQLVGLGGSQASDNKIVWWSDVNGQPDIFYYDLISRETHQITDDPENQVTPDIGGDWIIWSETHENDGHNHLDIVAFNVVTNERIEVTRDHHNQQWALTDGELIAWEQYDEGYDVYAYDLVKREIRALTTADGDQRWPLVSGGIVSWLDDTERTVYAMNSETNEISEVYHFPENQHEYAPKHYNGNMIWQLDHYDVLIEPVSIQIAKHLDKEWRFPIVANGKVD